ncbi:alpha/beta hydrolase [Aestuariivivens insulae]|uniref:alpha/beta hydrolase n=1 Tax=Aestuariivivens insulae TaxID=1621988 RepID=UPI001F5805EB|nr:alpha/beta hydrolase [Aestuariivivens insulae]
MNKVKNALVLMFIAIFISSCSKDDLKTQRDNVTQLPNDVTKLYVEKGNTKSNKVILYSNGGPDSKLSTDYFDDLNFSEFHEVYVHQTNTYNKRVIVGLNENLTFERAIKEDQVSVKILYRVIEHFRKQGKEVYVVGHSFGAVLIPSLIAEYKPKVKKYLIMAGRLDFPDLVWQGFRDRKSYIFKEGVTPTPENFSSDISEVEKKESYAKFRLQAGFGKNRYTQLLKDIDLSNVIYAFGEKDEAVGRLTNKEINFLTTHKATVYKVPDGSHSSMFESPHKEKLKKLMFD